jgi:hypothetical protein
MPRAVFCIHALSLIMYRNGSAPKIQDLYGRAQFTEDEISIMQVCGAVFPIRMFLASRLRILPLQAKNEEKP